MTNLNLICNTKIKFIKNSLNKLGEIMKKNQNTHKINNKNFFYSTILSFSTILILSPPLSYAGIDIDQTPLTVAKPLPPNIWFILDDSGSMGSNYMPQGLSSNGVTRSAYTRNSIFYNPHVNYQPWHYEDGSLMPNADKKSVSNNLDRVFDEKTNKILDPLNLTDSNQCFHSPISTQIGDTNNNNSLYRYRLNKINTAGQLTASRCSASTNCAATNGCIQITNFEWTLPSGVVITRSIDEEWQNYANWYSYYRTRMKMAKASVSRAFSSLDENFRVGYTSIWDKNKFEIPYENDDGLFNGSNRKSWFSNLFKATSSGTTPLRVALGRAGEYFSTANPYKNSDGTELSCRQNFTILTTDGYWNGNGAGNSAANNDNDSKDGEEITGPNGQSYQYIAKNPYKDDRDGTLADVAMYYWKNDLRPTENNVPTTASNPAFWQHMRTFGVSIGEKGSLDPATDLPKIAKGEEKWPEPVGTTNSETAANIDDLWHATVNSRGEFIIANNADEFTKALQDSLASIASETGRAASGAASSTMIDSGTHTYFSEYSSGTWSGDMRAYKLDYATGKPIDGEGWSAHEALPEWADRKIYFNKNGTQTPFTYNNLTSAQQAVFDNNESIINYLRGDRSNEKTATNPTGTLRARDSELADFVNSQPVYVAKPLQEKFFSIQTFSGADTYVQYVESEKGRTPVIYVGGNGGMLHAFNGQTGEEIYAFIPASVITPELKDYSNPEYEHHYFVDGELTVADVYLDGKWKTILVGSLGRGGKALFALDVTDPDDIQFMWEVSSNDLPQLGNNLGKPIISQIAEGDWRVLVGNGPNGNDDTARLVMISIADGSISTISTNAGDNNGLAGIASWDADKDGLFETVYAGDLNGNVWRFTNLTSTSPTVLKLFTTAAGQPITASPMVAVDQKTEHTWVFIGTGQYLNEVDRENETVQSWYGLIDLDDNIPSRSELVERKILQTGTVSGQTVRTIEEGGDIDIATSRGWYIDLDASSAVGERIITSNIFYGSVLLTTTFIPDASDLCNPGGRSALWGINPFTGGRLGGGLFDLNKNGTFNDTLNGDFPSVLDGLPPIITGTPPITRKAGSGQKDSAKIHLSPTDDVPLSLFGGELERESWREVTN